MSFAEQNRKLAAKLREARAALDVLENLTGAKSFAKDKPCQFRVPGICNHDPATSVWAHVNRGGISGIGQKAPSICGGVACSDCHDWIDGRSNRASMSTDPRDSMILEGVLRSQALVWKAAGLA